LTEQPGTLPGVVTSVIDLAEGRSGEPSAASTTATVTTGADSARIDGVKAVISLVVVGFAGVMSYIGLQGTDLTTVMRNQSLLVQFMGLLVLLAVVTAILSVFVKELETGRLTVGVELAVVLGQLALFPLIEAITPIPFVTSTAQSTAGWAVAAGLGIVAAGVLVAGIPAATTPHADGTPEGAVADGTASVGVLPVEAAARARREWVGRAGHPKHLNRTAFLRRPAGNTHLYLFLLVVSLLFTSLAVYTGLRLEVRNQLAAGVALQASLKQTGAQGVVTLDISASHLATEDFVVVNVTALESHASIASICRNAATVPGDYPCAADPCNDIFPTAAGHCDSLVGWDIPPDATGNVNRQLTFPFSTVTYQRLHIETSTCRRANLNTPAVCNLGQSNHIDLAVPSPGR
jgi:hypothetical protein